MLALDEAIQAYNRGLPENEQVHFSYGIGYGDILDTDDDMFGLEVNLASKIGRGPGRAGRGPAHPLRCAALEPALLRRVVPHRIVTFGQQAFPVSRLKLRGSRAYRGKVRRNPKR